MVQTEEQTVTQTERFWEERSRWVPRGVNAYSRIVADHAHGAELWDAEGRRYLDFAGGIGTLNVGHTPNEVVDALRDQAGKLIHSCFSVASYESYVKLARRLSQLLPGDVPKKAMFVNSGAEAVENAVKIARVATGRPHIISFHNSFHGRTYMGMSLTGRDRPYKIGFGPFISEVHHSAYPYPYRCPIQSCMHSGGPNPCPIESGDELERMLRDEVPANQVAAILVEPVQGEGGFVVPPPEFLRRLRAICDREGILLIADEVQTGFGRTGRFLAQEHSAVVPDITVLAKSLAAGMPLGAVVGRADVMDAPGPGGIGGTYGGNPLACRAALAVLDIMERDDLVGRAQVIGKTLVGRFLEMAQHYALIGEARGLGAMVAVELVRDRESKEPAPEETVAVMRHCHENGLLIIKAGLFDNVIRVLVPLVITDAQLNEGLDILEDAMRYVVER